MSTSTEILPDLKITTEDLVLIWDRVANTFKVTPRDPMAARRFGYATRLSPVVAINSISEPVVGSPMHVVTVSYRGDRDHISELHTDPVVSIEELKVYEAQDGGWI